MTPEKRNGPVTTRAAATAVIQPQDTAAHAERVVLGAILLDSGVVGPVAEILSGSGDFVATAHRAIYNEVLSQHGDGAPVDPVIIAQRLALRGELDRVEGGVAYLHALIAECPVTMSAPYYARIVRHAAEGRRFVLLGHQLVQAGELDDPEHRATAVSSVREKLAAVPLRAAVRLREALIDTAGLDGITPPEPLISDVLYRDSLVWLIGPPGNGKSFVGLDMAGSVGTGEPWQGYPAKQGTVLYLVAEGVAGVRARVRAWEESTGRAMVGVSFLPVAVQATSDGDWAALVDLAGELQPAMVVIDTQARVTVGMDENAARDMGMFVHRVDQLRARTGACVVVVHHQGRNGDHMRGSTALEGAATTIIKVAKADEKVTVTCTKQKDAEPFDDISLRLVPYGMSAILCLTTPGAGDQVLSGQDGYLAREWWDSFETQWVSPSRLMDAVPKVPKSSLYRALNKLVKHAIAEHDGATKRRTYRLPSDPSPRISQVVS